MEGVSEFDEYDSRGILQSFSSPSTLPHFLLLLVNSGVLFAIMKADWWGSAERGSVIFLSLTISYFFAAILAPSRIGDLIFRVDHGGRGVFSAPYWSSSLLALLPIGITVALVATAILTQLKSEDLITIAYLMASMFVLMSIGQAFSLTFGGIVYARRASKFARPGRSGIHFTITRTALAVMVFIPLVWWFGYDAGDVSEQSLTGHATWLGFLVVVALVSVVADKHTSRARSKEGMDGVAADRLMVVMVLATCWHLLSTWRRNPLFVDSTTGSMLVEEGILMAVTILLAVWSMANRGHKKGWRIFQGKSAVFWGIGFGYAYGGSIASLTALSEGSLLTTTAGGHLLTAIVMLAILPLAISRVGMPSSEESGAGVSVLENRGKPGASFTPPASVWANTHEQRGVRDERPLETTQEDVVEIID